MSANIRVLTENEVRQAVDWAAAEGWNPGLQDAATFYQAGPTAFSGLFELGKLHAVISVIQHQAGFGFLGFYICRPDMRGQGKGYALWQAGMAHLSPGCVGLDGVLDQIANYQASGFVLSHGNKRYSGVPKGLGPVPGVAFSADIPANFETYDRSVTGYERARYLKAWFAQPKATRRFAFVDGTLRGFGLSRPCREGHKIGPLYAQTPKVARALFSELAKDAEQPVILDVPVPNQAAVDLAQEAGLVAGFETARMYRGRKPAEKLQQIFGVTSFEFG